MALLYNVLAPKLGGIKLGMEGEEVKSIPVVSYALIMAMYKCNTNIYTRTVHWTGRCSCILTLTSAVIPQLTNATGAVMGAMFGGMWALFWIIVMPIMAFIFTFIGMALFALFYNIIIPKVGGIKLIFAEAGSAFELTNIPASTSSTSIISCISSIWVTARITESDSV